MGAFDKTYSVAELTENFDKKRNEIYDARQYFNSITPKHQLIEIELSETGQIDRLFIDPPDTAKLVMPAEFVDWNLSQKKTDSILIVLGWTTNTLKTLEQKLDAANCISISNGEPAKIGFKRINWVAYYFIDFDKPLPDSMVSHYNDSCKYVYVNKRLVLQYEGWLDDKQCFFNKKR